MSEDRSSLPYAASGPLDPPGSACRIEKNADGLFITIPPAKLGHLLAGPSVGIYMATILVIVSAVAILTPLRETGGDYVVLAGIFLLLLTCLASLWYQVLTVIKLARHGRNPVRISITADALSVENGTLGDMAESIKLPERISVSVRQSLPTLTLGRVVDMKFDGIDNSITLRFYTREGKLAQDLKLQIERELKIHEG